MGWNSNVFPLLIITASGGFTGLFAYSPGPGAGNLIASVTAQAGTDPYGNAYVAGVASYAHGTPAINADLTGGALQFNRPVNAAAASVGSNNSAALNLSSGQVNNTDVESILVLGPALIGGVAVAELLGSALELQEVAVPAADGSITAGPKLFGTLTGFLCVVADTLHGDGNTYNTGPALKTKGANQTIGTTTTAVTWEQGGTVLNLAANVTYVFKALIRAQQNAGAADLDDFQFTVTGTVTYSSIEFKQENIGGAANPWGVTNVNVNMSFGPAANTQYIVEIQGTVRLSTTGTFVLNAICGTGGGSFTVQQGTFMELIPSSAVN